MARNPLSLLGLAASVLCLANFAPADVGSVNLATRLQPRHVEATVETPAPKGDRLAPARPVNRNIAFTTVERGGAAQDAVLLRDRLGRVVYRADAGSSTTTVSKSADIPSVIWRSAVD